MNSARKFPAALTMAWLLVLPGPARAATLEEIFLLLPSSECGGYSVPQRKEMLDGIIEAPGETGPDSVPDSQSPWLRRSADNFMVLQRPRAGAITYKLFEGRSFQLLAVCRGRNRPAPGDPVEPLDISLYRMERQGLSRVELHDYLPAIGILDFITADTVIDHRAVQTLARLAPVYTECLSCSLSPTHRLTMDIVTATTINAAPCDNLLPTIGRLPLTWDGHQAFTKPYDRAAPREADLERRRLEKSQAASGR